MLEEKNVAVIGKGGEWSALPVVRELGSKGYQCYCIFESSNIAKYSKYVRGFYIVNPILRKDDLEKIVLICLKKNISKIICLHEDIKKVLVENKDIIKMFDFLCPTEHDFRIAVEKNKALDLSSKLGIPIPRTINLQEYDLINDIEISEGEVLVVKGTRGASSENVRYSKNILELKRNFKEIYERQKSYGSTSLPMIQEYIGGPTYLTQAIVQNGKVKIVIPHLKYREWPITGGVSCRAVTIDEPRLVEYMTLILEKLKWHGEVGMEWKYNKETDDYYLMEINPRFEGSLDLAIKSGVDMLGLMLEIMAGREIKGEIKYEIGVNYRWFFRYDFMSFLEKPDSLANYLIETFDPRINGELQFDDLAILRRLWKKPFRDLINKISNN